MERENLINSINQKIEELDLHLIREKVSDGDRVTINNRSIAIKELLDDLERAIDAFNKAKEEGLLEDVSLMGLSLILNTLSNLENEFKRIQNGQLSNLNNLGSQIAQLSNHLRIYVPKPLTTAEVKGLVDSYKLLKKSLKELEKERKKADEDLNILRNYKEEAREILHLATASSFGRTYSIKIRELQTKSYWALGAFALASVLGVLVLLYMSYCPPSYVRNSNDVASVLHVFLLKSPVAVIVITVLVLIWKEYRYIRDLYENYEHKKLTAINLLKGSGILRDKLQIEDSGKIMKLFIEPSINEIINPPFILKSEHYKKEEKEESEAQNGESSEES